MFLFRGSADTHDDSDERHEPVNGTMNHKPHDDAYAEDEEEAQAAYQDEEAYDAPREASGSAEAGSAGAREGTVPPLDEQDVLANGAAHAEEDVLEDDEDAAAAAPPAAPAAAHANGVPALPTTPRAYHPNGHGAGVPQRHSYSAAAASAFTPRGTALSPRSASGISRGYSYSVGAHSAGADAAEVFEQHYRRCRSVVKSARSHSARRASSVNGVMGYIEDEYAPTNRRTSAMTEGERMALERMMENELRRQEALERATQFALVRESAIVETELEREKANYARRVRRDEELHHRLEQSSRSREERTTAAAQRREVLEQERARAVFGSVAEKEGRYHTHDPYALIAANRRYSATLRAAAAIAPQRRTTSPSHMQADRRPSAPTPVEAPAATGGPRRSSTPRIDMSRPRQCLTVNDWKTPEQLRREAEEKDRPNRGPAPVRCLSPKAWRAPTVVDHPRQWH